MKRAELRQIIKEEVKNTLNKIQGKGSEEEMSRNAYEYCLDVKDDPDFKKYIKENHPEIIIESELKKKNRNGKILLKEAAHIDYYYVLKTLKEFRSKIINKHEALERIKIDLGLKTTKQIHNLTEHMNIIFPMIEDGMSVYDLRKIAHELVYEMKF